MFSKNCKKFIGCIPSESLAARIYDKRTIILKGFSAKTNFNYTKRQLAKILSKKDEDIRESEFDEE